MLAQKSNKLCYVCFLRGKKNEYQNMLDLTVILYHHMAEIRLFLSSGENITSSIKGNFAYLFY